MPGLRLHALPGLVLCLALLAGACGGDDGGDGSAPPSTESAAEDATEPDDATEPQDATEVVTSTDAELDLPRSVVYAGLELEVTDATWSNATPSTFTRDEPSVGNDVLLYLEVTAAFTEGFPGDDGAMPVRHFLLETADGDRLPATGVDFLGEVPVSASSDSTAILAFALTAEQLDGAVFGYDDTEHVAAMLPLDGAVPTSPYPVRTEVGEVASPELATGCDPAPADVELVAVEWDLDGGVAVDGTKLARGRSSRVDVDHRWLRAELQVTARVGACGGTYANQTTFRVLADGTVIDPANVYSLTLSDGEVAPMTFLFQVPADATDVTLDAGAQGASTVAFELAIPTLP